MCQTWMTLKAISRVSRNGAGHLHVLRAEQHVAAIDAVGDDAADQREQEDRDAAPKTSSRPSRNAESEMS